MEWTQIIIAAFGFVGSICTISLPIILPIVISRSNKKTREMTGAGTQGINSRIEKVETSVKTLCTQVEESHRITQGLHLLDVIEHRPYCWETIRQMFTEYQRVGGNGHVGRVYQQWEADYGQYYDAGDVPPALIKRKRASNTQKQSNQL